MKNIKEFLINESARKPMSKTWIKGYQSEKNNINHIDFSFDIESDYQNEDDLKSPFMHWDQEILDDIESIYIYYNDTDDNYLTINIDIDGNEYDAQWKLRRNSDEFYLYDTNINGFDEDIYDWPNIDDVVMHIYFTEYDN